MEDGLSKRELELRLAPPGDQQDIDSTCITKSSFNQKDYDPSLLFLGNSYSAGSKRLLEESQALKFVSSSSQCYNYQQEHDLLPVMGKESSQRCCSKGLQNTDKYQAFSMSASAVNKTDGPNTSQKRKSPAPRPVVGWPPIRSFRKNIASSTSSKLKVEPKQQNVAPPQKSASVKQVENCCKGLFVKINMDGVPIGRKVDLKTYDSYDKLSCSVDELFGGLLAAQRDPSDDKIQNSDEREKLITGLLDGKGEYTLVYEDEEGDRMLVGDVPWHMFVHTVKRLRVLKSSELSSLFFGSKEQETNRPVDATLKQAKR
ncbi:Auxin-responsive protein [Heracleum sosnowskyi]|uniref:Auxin-responsive protein n=1 Tax=Heracleum sosnowskyi TaxID=360622 RepID=A0AAD8M5K6_9APIA|nr:Auxin-responsive protein [Heracleum sosnowskyi]